MFKNRLDIHDIACWCRWNNEPEVIDDTHANSSVPRDFRNELVYICRISSLPCYHDTPSSVRFPDRRGRRRRNRVRTCHRVSKDFQRILRRSFRDKIQFKFRPISLKSFSNYFPTCSRGILVFHNVSDDWFDRAIWKYNCIYLFRYVRVYLPFAMIAGVTVWTLSAHVSALYVCRIIELTVWTEIVALDQKWAGASFAIVRCAFQSNTVKTGRAAIAFRAHGVMFAGLSNKNKIDFKFRNTLSAD